MPGPLTEEGQGILGAGVLAYGVVVILLNYYLNRDSSKKPPASDGTYKISLSLSLSFTTPTRR